jgi:release factor glutamine methyltransferase
LEVLRWTTGHLQEKGVSEPRASAEVLLAHVLGISRLDLYLRYDQPLSPPELTAFKALIRHRRQGEPVAYLTGHKEFWSLDFLVTPAVLSPRPETEILVDTVLSKVKKSTKFDPDLAENLSENRKSQAANRLWGLEVGVGSGAVVVALAKELPDFWWAVVDISAAALALAGVNARRHGVEPRLYFFQGNLLSGLKQGPHFDLLVANLPYITQTEYDTLPPEIRAYEPQGALLGGAEGLDWLRPLTQEAHHYLKPGAWLALEVGHQQAQTVRDLLHHTGVYGHL